MRAAQATSYRMTGDSGPGNWSMANAKLTVGDFNGDGRTDIGAFYSYLRAQTKLWRFNYVATDGFNTSMVWDSGLDNWELFRTTTVDMQLR